MSLAELRLRLMELDPKYIKLLKSNNYEEREQLAELLSKKWGFNIDHGEPEFSPDGGGSTSPANLYEEPIISDSTGSDENGINFYVSYDLFDLSNRGIRKALLEELEQMMISGYETYQKKRQRIDEWVKNPKRQYKQYYYDYLDERVYEDDVTKPDEQNVMLKERRQYLRSTPLIKIKKQYNMLERDLTIYEMHELDGATFPSIVSSLSKKRYPNLKVDTALKGYQGIQEILLADELPCPDCELYNSKKCPQNRQKRCSKLNRVLPKPHKRSKGAKAMSVKRDANGNVYPFIENVTDSRSYEREYLRISKKQLKMVVDSVFKGKELSYDPKKLKEALLKGLSKQKHCRLWIG